jgi:hypothetical protein
VTHEAKMIKISSLASLLVLTLFCALVSGCSPVSDDELAGLVREEVGRQLAQLDILPTPESVYWPTIEDYRLGVGGRYRTLGYFDQYAAAYVASKCIAGEALTAEGFRGFVYGTFDSLSVRAWAATREIVARAETREKSGLPAVNESCERPILYPESGAEAALAIGLFKAMMTLCLPRHLQDGLGRTAEEYAARWFNLDQPPKVSLVVALGGVRDEPCRSGGGLPLPPKVSDQQGPGPVPTAVPTQGVALPQRRTPVTPQRGGLPLPPKVSEGAAPSPTPVSQRWEEVRRDLGAV